MITLIVVAKQDFFSCFVQMLIKLLKLGIREKIHFGRNFYQIYIFCRKRGVGKGEKLGISNSSKKIEAGENAEKRRKTFQKKSTGKGER